MKILFAASEMTPYAKTGGLGDVVGALPRKLSGLGHEVTCCVPFYRGAREVMEKNPPPAPPVEGSGALPAAGMLVPQSTLKIPLGDRVVTGEVLEMKQRDGVRVLFVRCDEFFDRAELYGEEDRDYEDNAERFLFFSKAVAELAGDARVRPDVVHCHDWQTGLVPVLMSRTHPQPLRGRGAKKIATVFTIHNMAYQGVFPKAAFGLTNLPGKFFTPAGLEFYGQMNLLKGGIVFADALTTVSRTYAEEIQTAEGGCGLEGVLATRAGDLRGIINGVDYEQWNPETDEFLRHHYTMDDLSGKRACREELVRRLGIEGSGLPTPSPSGGGEASGERERRARRSRPTNDEAGPVVGFVSRLTEQKGVEVLAGAIEDLVRAGVVLAILGKGERKYEEMLTAAAKRFPRQVVARIGQDEELAHQIQAGANMLVMPSRFEPCGLTQLYAMRYGTIPVVRATGGLDDTVVQYRERTGAGTGFKFALYESAALVEAVRCAILLYKQPQKWEKLTRNAMACDFSWQASAKEYERLYAAL
jgi:starch synthase